MESVDGAKACRKCGVVKGLDQFTVRVASYDGRTSRCRACLSRKTGKPIGRPPGDPVARFETNYCPEPTTGCWLWTGRVDRKGYGGFTIGTRNIRAHRAAWELYVGPIPEGDGYHGTCVCHRCDTPACVNPAHLFLGTAADNNHDKVSKGRQPRGVESYGATAWANVAKTHCPYGHPYSGENLRIKNGQRICKTCDRAARKRWREERLEECRAREREYARARRSQARAASGSPRTPSPPVIDSRRQVG